MKLLKLLTIVLIFVVAGCNDSLLDTETLTDNALKSGHNNPLTFESEFEIWLSGERTTYYEDHYVPDEDGNLILTKIPVALDQIIEGTGNARHLGKTKLINEEEIDFKEWVFGRDDNFYGSAYVTFIAANGDEIHFETTSEMHYKNYDRTTQIVIIKGTSSTFVKGTGRFKNAIGGTLHKDGVFNDNDDVFAGTATYTATVFFKKK